MAELKSCPFCGVTPTLVCDLTDWRGQPVYKPYDNGYRPISYYIKAEHKIGCYFRKMNGMNEDGRMSASNWQCLIEAWNRRKGEQQ